MTMVKHSTLPVKVNLNGIEFTTSGMTSPIFKIYNLFHSGIYELSIHIEPILLKDGYDYILAAYIDGSPKIFLTIEDDTIYYPITANIVGSTFSSKILYKRTGLAGKKEVETPIIPQTGVASVTIQPIFGNDNTTYGRDYVERINNDYYYDGAGNTRNASDFTDANGFRAKTNTVDIVTPQYTYDDTREIHDHVWNTDKLIINQATDKTDDDVEIGIWINDHASINLQEIQTALEDVMFIVQPSLYNIPDKEIYNCYNIPYSYKSKNIQY